MAPPRSRHGLSAIALALLAAGAAGLLVPAALLAAGLGLTFQLHQGNRRRAEQLLETRFDLRVSDLVERLEERLTAYEQVLRGTRGLFEGSEAVGRHEFASYVQGLDLERQYPGIQGVGFAMVLRPGERAAHVAQVRREVPSVPYELHPGGERSLLTSIVYLEPFRDRNLKAFGYDMYSEPVRRAALERARDGDEAAISGKVRLVQETESDVQAGFLMFLPVYRNGVPHATSEERRANLLGWVYSPFRSHDLMAGVRGPQYADLGVTLFDGEVATPEHLLYSTPEPSDRAAGNRFTAVRQLRRAGRTWTLGVSSSPEFEHQLAAASPLSVPVVGTAASVLAALLARLLLRGRARAEELVHSMTKELREREEWLRAIYLGSPLGIARSDLEGRILDANPAFLRMVGYELQELVGTPLSRLTPAESADEAARQCRALAELRVDRIHQQETRWLRKDQGIIWVSLNVQSVLDAAGRPRFLFGVVEDITERRRIQEALQRERRRYLSFMTIAQDGIHLIDDRGVLVEANEAFLRLLGHGPEVVGRLNAREWDASLEPEQFQGIWRALVERPSVFQTRHRRKDGSVLDVEVNAGGVELEGQQYLLASARDITARKEVEQQLAAKQAQLEELNRSLEDRIRQAVAELRAKDQLLITSSRHASMGEMIGNIAHQWRQPLNALGLVLANLRDASRAGELDRPAVEKAVGDGNRLVQKMSSTINDFRDFFRPEKEKAAFSALAQLRETVGLLDASFRHAGIDLEIEAQSEPTLFGHANELSQVLLNLLSNARQAIQGSQTARGRVTVSLSERDGLGCITVRDNGGGIPEAILDKIFEPYFSTKEGGTGIGLYMSRQIVERSLGGRLEARNVEGGAEFTLLVPLCGSGGRPEPVRGPGDP